MRPASKTGNIIMEKKEIVLVRVEGDQVYHPLSILYVGGALRKAGYNVRLFNVFEQKIEKCIEEIIAINPLFVGFSVFTGRQTEISAKMSLAIKRKNRNIPIVWGGIHPSLLPLDCLREEFIDMVCIREGEETACEIAECFNERKDVKHILGIGYKDKKTGKIIINPNRPFMKNLDEYRPDWELLSSEEIEKCIDTLPDGRKKIDFIGSRGCPFNCAFCYNLLFHERRWRKHSTNFVIREISYLKKTHNIGAVTFHDDNFFVNKERALYILEELKKMDVISTSCLLRLELIEEDLLDKLSDLGVGRIFVGWESGNDRILKLINKGFDTNFIIEKFKIISKFPNILVTGASIIGFPTETLDEIFNTVNLGIKLAELVPNVVVTFQTYLPYPGSHLYELSKKNGFNPPTNIFNYGKFDTFAGEMQLTWLPWATEKTPRFFYVIDKYGKLLTHSKSSTKLRTVAKEFFYRLI